MTAKHPVSAGPGRDLSLEQRLAEALGANQRGMLRAFQTVGSTMDEAHALAADGAADGSLIVALRQSQGRGRQGRVWESPEGGVYLSVVLRPTKPMDEVPQLALVAGVALAEAVKAVTRLLPSIRWPNDLLLGEKKLAGILCEGARGKPAPTVAKGGPGGQGAGSAYVILGIGINVLTSPDVLPETGTSLAAAGAPCEAAPLTAALYTRLLAWYDVWARNGFAPVRAALRPWIGLFGQIVHISAGSERLEGVAHDLDERGRLVVRLDSGILRPFDMGEVTLLR